MSKTILITGASRGIGKAIALELAKEDINIVINCAHDMDNLTMLRDELLSKGACCEMYKADVSNFDEVYRMFDFTLQKFGKIDVLINNAGIASIGLFQNTTPEMWNNILGCNLNSVYNCCHFAVNDMLKRHEGKIINISSVWGNVGASCEVAYSATKGAVNSMTKALAKEVAPSNIQVNAIACGAIDTDMNSHLSDEDKAALALEIPAGRFGLPSEIGKIVKGLICAPDYLTGQIITVDGGWL